MCLRWRLIWLGETEITKRFTLPEVKVFIEFALKTVCSEDFSPQKAGLKSSLQTLFIRGN